MDAFLTARRALLPASLALLAMLAGCDRFAEKPAFKGIDITGAPYAATFKLPDSEGRERSLAEFKGQVVLVFFGYTQCPDVCPTTLVELADVKRQLGPDGSKLQGIFVTVDPERDTPALLKQYVAGFDPSFIALRGTAEQTQATAKDFKVFYGKVAGKAEGNYTIDHTAGSFLFDPQGRVRLFVRYGGGAEALLHDIKLLQAGA
jgi:protein SCO1/2